MSMTNSIWNRSLWDLNFILCPHRFPTKPAKKDGESSLRSYQFYWKIYFSRDPNKSKAGQEKWQISGLSSGWLRIVLVPASVSWFCFALFGLLIIINGLGCSGPKQISCQSGAGSHSHKPDGCPLLSPRLSTELLPAVFFSSQGYPPRCQL